MRRRDVLKTIVLGATGELLLRTGFDARSAEAQAPITAQNWSEAVAFAPDVSAPELSPGARVHKGNVNKLAAFLPQGLLRLVQKYELKLNLSAYQPVHPSLGYVRATAANLGKTKVWDVGQNYRQLGIQGYVAGLPFPKPKTGLEVAWNALTAYAGDDADRYYDVYWISARSGIEHNEYWRWASVKTMARTDVTPTPSIPEQERERIAVLSLSYALEPYDKKGFGALYSKSADPIDLQGHVYMPTMRRVLRHTFGTRGDSWNATDYLYEDVGGYLGAAEWMNWKILSKRTMLMPVHAGAVRGKEGHVNFEFDQWPHWNPKVKWQPRPVYVVEATPKIADYPYSRMVLVVDAETFYIPYKEAFDKKGELWKILLNCTNAPDDMNSKPLEIGVAVAIDLQAGHATAVNFRKHDTNTNLDLGLFTLASLRKRST